MQQLVPNFQFHSSICILTPYADLKSCRMETENEAGCVVMATVFEKYGGMKEGLVG